MNMWLKRVLYWAPRIVCIVIAVSASMLFTAEMLGEVQREGYGFGKTILKLLAVQLPSLFILGVLAISWRREWVPALLFFALAGFFVWLWRGNPLSSDLPAAATLALVGLVFLLNWIYRDQLRMR